VGRKDILEPVHKASILPLTAARPVVDHRLLHNVPSVSFPSPVNKMHSKSVLAALLAPAAVSAQLNDLAVRAGLKYFGTALREGAINSDSRYAAILGDKTEFGQLVPENGQKWESTEPSQGQFTYTQGDITANTAKKNGQGMRCHTMVWYSQLPSWVRASLLASVVAESMC
jgi:GH35 family endo-1,4-beta-xylanase